MWRFQNKQYLSLCFALLALLYGLGFINSITDWVSFAVDEGFTHYAAERFRQGEVPHKDFFFLWTPGVIFLHAAWQFLVSEAIPTGRYLLLFCFSLYFLLLWRELEFFVTGVWGKFLASCLLLVWGCSLWFIPYSSWYANGAVLLAILFLQKEKWLWAGISFALAFWFKQNIGILSALFASLFFLYRKDWLSLGRLALGVSLGLLPGMLYFGSKGALAPLLKQTLLFPLTYKEVMFQELDAVAFGRALRWFGVWLLSLYLFSRDAKKFWRFFGLALFGGFFFYSFLENGDSFLKGLFYLAQFLAWPLALVFLLLERKFDAKKILFLLPAFGAFLQIYPRFDFQHFLFGFVFTLPLLLYTFQALRRRYPQLPAFVAFAPLFFLLFSGALLQFKNKVQLVRGGVDAFGFHSTREAKELNDEMKQVVEDLRTVNGKNPILILPNATVFYSLSGMKNGTAHNQFFPQYVESYGESQAEVLQKYQSAGGRYIVWQRHSGTEKNVPTLALLLEQNYRLWREYPVHFRVLERKP